VDNKILYDLLKEMRDEQRSQSDELNRQSKYLVVIQKDIERNTIDLTEHKEGVIQNRESIRLLRKEINLLQDKYDEAIERLQEPGKIRQHIYNKAFKYLMFISVLLGVIVTAGKLLKLW